MIASLISPQGSIGLMVGTIFNLMSSLLLQAEEPSSQVGDLQAANQRLLADVENLEQGRDLMAGQVNELQKQAQMKLMQLEKQVSYT
jgi:hypothetical protein